MNNFRMTILIALLFQGSPVFADQWSFDKEVKKEEFVFGETKIIKITDTTENTQYPDYKIYIYTNNELRAFYRGLSFEFIFADKTNKIFVSLSNSGLHPAYMTFNASGDLRQLLQHEEFVPNYCHRSVTVSKVWVDKNDPKVEFVYETTDYGREYVKEITFINCHGERVPFYETYIKGIEQKAKEYWAFKKEYQEYLEEKEKGKY